MVEVLRVCQLVSALHYLPLYLAAGLRTAGTRVSVAVVRAPEALGAEEDKAGCGEEGIRGTAGCTAPARA